MPEPLWDRAMRMQAAGQADQAIALVRTHLRIQPKDARALNLMGILLRQAGQLQQAVAVGERAVAAEPAAVPLRHNLANAYLAMGRRADAIAQWQRCVAQDPGFMMGWAMLASALSGACRSEEAIAAGRRAVALEPGAPEAVGNLAVALTQAGRVEESVALAREALARMPGAHRLRSNMLLDLNYLERAPDEILAEHRAFGATVPAPRAPRAAPIAPDAPLRVGVLSPDLAGHSVSTFAEALVRRRPAGTVMLAFSTAAPAPDHPEQRRVRTWFDAWHECRDLDDAALDALLRRERLDVLLELSGHSGGNRLPALATKPAPVIVTALGYPNTTGVPAIDLRLVDAITDPPGAEARCTERLLRIDPCFLCWTPPADAPLPTLPPPDAPVTFGSFNNAAKIGPATAALWAGAMAAVPGSRLLLKAATLGDPAARGHLLATLAGAGIDASRVEAVPFAGDRAAHLALYGRVHVALDSTPYNGTTTTCEALWMGVPVVALRGDRHAARVSASLLSAAGHPEWATDSAEAFARAAAALATDRARLASLRGSLRAELAGSPLLDAATHAARVHAALADARRAAATAG